MAAMTGYPRSSKMLNDEVLLSEEAIVTVGREEIDWLKAQAARNPRKRVRLCAHTGLEDRIHEMLIVHARETYIRPQKHLNKTESVHLIEGAVDVVMMNEHGHLLEVIPMRDAASGGPFYYRIAEPYYHTMFIRSDFVVFHETTNGPFVRTDTVFAPWSPPDDDGAAIRQFMDQLAGRVEAFRTATRRGGRHEAETLLR